MRLLRLASPLLLVMGCAAEEGTPDLREAVQRATVCADGPTLVGIDVSKWQAEVDWDAVAADGVSYAFARVSDGVNTPDAYFAANWAGIKAAGLVRGAYQYFRPSQSVPEQARMMLDAIGTLEPGDLAPVIDVEADGGLAPAQVAAKVDEWIALVEAATARRPIVYTGRFFWQDQVGGHDARPSPLWIAHYTDADCPNIPSPWTDWSFWQFTDAGTVDGVDGGVDVNLFNGDLAALAALGQAGPTTCGDAVCGADEDVDSCAVDCPPCGVIGAAGGVIDDRDACFTGGGPAQFLREVEDAGHDGTLTWTHATDAGAAANSGAWSFYLAEAGTYRLEAFTAAAYAESVQAEYLVTAAAGAETAVVIDQTAVDGWQVLGDFAMSAGGFDQGVFLGDNTGEPGATDTRVVFDAVRLTRLDAPVEPPPDDDPPVDDGDDVDAPDGGCHAGGAGGGPGAIAMLALLGLRRRRRRA